MPFTPEQEAAISDLVMTAVKSAVAPLLPPTPAETDLGADPNSTTGKAYNERHQVIETNPLLTVVDEVLEDILRNPQPPLIVRGSRGSQIIDQNAERSNLCFDLLQQRKSYGTRKNVR